MRNPFKCVVPRWGIPFDLEHCRRMILKLEDSHGLQCVAACEAIEELSSVFASLAFDAQGCRVAQKALEVAGLDVKVRFASQIGGHVVEAAESPHANFVLQKVIETLPPSRVSFVINELIGSGTRVVQNRFGVRIFCRLLEYCFKDMVEDLIAEVTQDIAQLCQHQHGSYFAQHLIEHDFNRGEVLRAVIDNPISYAASRRGCELISFALKYLDATQRHALLEKFLDDTNGLVRMSCKKRGQGLVLALLKFPESGNIRSSLSRASSTLRSSKYGKHTLKQLCA